MVSFLSLQRVIIGRCTHRLIVGGMQCSVCTDACSVCRVLCSFNTRLACKISREEGMAIVGSRRWMEEKPSGVSIPVLNPLEDISIYGGGGVVWLGGGGRTKGCEDYI